MLQACTHDRDTASEIALRLRRMRHYLGPLSMEHDGELRLAAASSRRVSFASMLYREHERTSTDLAQLVFGCAPIGLQEDVRSRFERARRGIVGDAGRNPYLIGIDPRETELRDGDGRRFTILHYYAATALDEKQPLCRLSDFDMRCLARAAIAVAHAAEDPAILDLVAHERTHVASDEAVTRKTRELLAQHLPENRPGKNPLPPARLIPHHTIAFVLRVLQLVKRHRWLTRAQLDRELIHEQVHGDTDEALRHWMQCGRVRELCDGAFEYVA